MVSPWPQIRREVAAYRVRLAVLGAKLAHHYAQAEQRAADRVQITEFPHPGKDAYDADQKIL